jgi:hypothetical protein
MNRLGRLTLFLSLPALGLLLASTPARAEEAPPATRKPENAFARRIGQAVVSGGFQMDGYWVWCPSVVKGDDGLFHMFASRWPKRLPFHPGWMVASEVVHATSKTAEGPYKFSEVVLPARGPQYWDGRSTHNPKILRQGKTWVLFYMGSTHPFADVDKPETLTLDSPYAVIGRANKRIGVATAPSPSGPWTRRDAPVLATKPGTFYSFLTSNPAPYIDKDGSVLLLFKGRGHGTKFPYQTPMSIGVARAPKIDGPYTVVSDQPIFGVDHVGEVEDPFLWKDKDGFHVLAKDQRGGITGEKHAGFIAHSPDGTRWTVDPAPLAYSKRVTWTDGKQQVMGQLERPNLLFQDGTPTHMFFATMDGPGGFQNGTKTWNMVVRLKSGR